MLSGCSCGFAVPITLFNLFSRVSCCSAAELNTCLFPPQSELPQHLQLFPVAPVLCFLLCFGSRIGGNGMKAGQGWGRADCGAQAGKEKQGGVKLSLCKAVTPCPTLLRCVLGCDLRLQDMEPDGVIEQRFSQSYSTGTLQLGSGDSAWNLSGGEQCTSPCRTSRGL